MNFNSTIGNGTFTYTLPSATGTLALTSNLSAYLPLTGGTLTGALSGTSATFSGNVTTAGYFITPAAATSGGLSGFLNQYNSGNLSSRSWRITNDLLVYGDFAIQQSTTQTGSTYANQLYFNATGAATFSSSVSATSLTATNGYSYFYGLRVSGNDTGNTIYNGNASIGITADSGNRIFIGQVGSSTVGLNVLTASGNVGIGTSSPSNKLTISNNGNAAVAFRINDTNANASFLSLNVSDSDAAIIAGGTSGIPFDIYTGGSIRMRIRNDGIVMIGTTAYNSAIKGILLNPDGYAFYTADGANVMYLNRLTSDGNIIQFQKDTSVVGSISTNTYSLPSDLNFKKNINTLELGLNLVTKLRAVSYNHKIDDEGAALSTGFIAQELEQSLNELGVQQNEYYILQHKPNKDETQSQYWLDYTKMIPILVNAIQELKLEIDELKNK